MAKKKNELKTYRIEIDPDCHCDSFHGPSGGWPHFEYFKAWNDTVALRVAIARSKNKTCGSESRPSLMSIERLDISLAGLIKRWTPLQFRYTSRH